MTKVIISKDCGNSPKNLFVQELAIALAKKDVKSILQHAADDLQWNLVGNKMVEGKENVAEMVRKSETAAELRIDHIATHGKTGAVDGELKLANGKTLAFCDIYEFANAKGEAIKAITSYRIETLPSHYD